MNPTGKSLIVPEFVAVGIPGLAFLLYAVKGGGFMPIPPFDKEVMGYEEPAPGNDAVMWRGAFHNEKGRHTAVQKKGRVRGYNGKESTLDGEKM